jgi:hypothetical protein
VNLFKSKTKVLNATCVIALTEDNIEFLRKMQMNHDIPEEAKYIAFLEDGDATFLTSLSNPSFLGNINIPQMKMIAYYENIAVEFHDE